jgi:GTP-binding protein
MYDWIIANGYHPVIIATKLDKIKRSQKDKCIKIIKDKLRVSKETVVIPFSAETKQGRDEIWTYIEDILSSNSD